MPVEERKTLDEMPNEAIDYSDIPPLEHSRWVRFGPTAEAGNKRKVIVKLDADVVDFFHSTECDENRMNAVLREYMKSQQKAS